MHLFKGKVFRLLLSVAALFSTTAAVGQERPAAAFPLTSHSVADKLGRRVTYYLSRPAQPAPLLLMIQGSGCTPVLQGTGASMYSTVFDLLPFAAEGRFAVMAVEKPSASGSNNSGTAQGCTPQFNKDFTAERWLIAIRAALEDALHQENVDTRRILVLGASEGAAIASLLAGQDQRITDVIVVGGSGTTQLFDFIATAYSNCFDRSSCITDVESQIAAICADPASATKFAWGHPYRRWTSFFSVEPGDELARSHARIYLAFGTADTSTPPLSQEVAVAKLLVAGRDITVRRVPNANHSLLSPGDDTSALDREYRRALDWFWATPKPR